jgi:hypothetical protein
MNMNMVILNRDRAGSLHREMSRCSAPPVSVKDCFIVELCTSRLYSTNHIPVVSPISAILSREWPTTHPKWRDGESSVYPHSQGLDWRCTVLSGGARPGHDLEDLSES